MRYLSAANVVLILLSLVPVTTATEATLTVHIDQPGIKISPLLYGIFFEEINRAGEGGLYAEMLQNRSFEDDRGDRDQKPKKIPGWSLVASRGAKATINLDNSEPLNPHNPTSLRLEITAAGQTPVGVANNGFTPRTQARTASNERSSDDQV